MNDIKQLADRIAALEKRVADIKRQGRSHPSEEKLSKDISVKEFMLSKNPSGDVEKTLLIAYFLERFTGMASFNVDDLSRSFQLAKEPTPGNINDKVNKNIRNGHMTEAKEKKDKKKAWLVTTSGEKYVENDFKD